MAKKLNVPLSKVYMDEEIKNAVLKVLDSGWYILGQMVKEFEREFAKFCGVKHAVCTSSGTTAIFLSLEAVGLKPNDEVIIPSFSFVSTASPIIHLGGKPVFVDINPRTFTLIPAEVEKRISRRTKAIIPVHLFGHPADMDAIMEVAEENDLFVVEDAAQAHGAEYKGRKVGGIGHLTCFSFYPSKNMTVCGDGGIVTTNNQELAEKVSMLRNHGRLGEKYIHRALGYNFRFNEIQAAIGKKQLEKLPTWNEHRRKTAQIYTEALEDAVTVPIEEKWAKHVYHMYVIKAKERDELRAFLDRRGVSTGIHYPVPIHKQPAIEKSIGSKLKLKKTEECANLVLSLPMHPQLTQTEIDYVCESTLEFYEKKH